MTLTANNTYAGTTTIDAGATLCVGSNANVFPTNSGNGIITVNGTLDLNGYSPTINGLSGTGTVTCNASRTTSTLYVGNANTTSTFAGVVQDGSGTVALTKVGTGTFALAGNNTYSGGTTISNGTLQVGNWGSTGTLGSGNVVDNASLIFCQFDTLTIANAISGTGSLTQSSWYDYDGGDYTGSTLILTGNNTYTGGTVIGAASTLQVGNGGTSGTLGSGAITGGATNFWTAGLVFDLSGNAVVFANAISGHLNLVKEGPDVLMLAGNLTYTGTTTVKAGKLVYSGPSRRSPRRPPAEPTLACPIRARPRLTANRAWKASR